MNSLRNQEQNTSGQHMPPGNSTSLVPHPSLKTDAKYGVLKFPVLTNQSIRKPKSPSF